jgi:hypothetical protein
MCVVDIIMYSAKALKDECVSSGNQKDALIKVSALKHSYR